MQTITFTIDIEDIMQAHNLTKEQAIAALEYNQEGMKYSIQETIHNVIADMYLGNVGDV